MSSHGAVYTGTSGVGKHASFRRTFQIAWVLAKSDLKQRYFGSVVGALWTLIRPLMLFAVLYVVFSNILRVGGDVPNYPLYLLMALSFWGAFGEITAGCLNSLVARSGVLQKISVPVVAVPLAMAIGAAIQFAASLSILLLFLIVTSVPIQVGWLLLPVAAALTMLFAWGAGLLLSISYARYRDIGPIWDVFTQLMFWGTPVIYVSTFPSTNPIFDGGLLGVSMSEIIGLNPLAQIFTELRHYVIDSGAPTVAEVYPAWVTITSCAIFIGVVIVGFLVFRAKQDRVVEYL